jgi:group II intron reverse transcriptase/maturase
VAQRVIVMLLEPIYEQDFLPCSYGFRPGRSAHEALHTLRTAFMTQGLRWVLDVDIVKYFDSISHSNLRSFLDRRVTDGVVRRMINKWLRAGVLEEGTTSRSTEGTPQGGVISPLLANIYLHDVLDEWFETVARPRLKGRCILVRYADDAVLAFEDHLAAKRALAVLAKRLGRFGLTLHPNKTRFVDFRFKRPGGTRHPATDGTSFNFLGFTHVWGTSRNGKNVVRQVTAKDRYARTLSAVSQWCRDNRGLSIAAQHAHLSKMARGHFAYYGITGNGRRIRWYLHQMERIWKKWLSRRGGGNVLWARLRAFLDRQPLPKARIIHKYGGAWRAHSPPGERWADRTGRAPPPRAWP